MADRQFKAIWAGLKEVRKRFREHTKVDKLEEELIHLEVYGSSHFCAVEEDPDLISLLGLLYAYHHSHKFQDLIPKHLLQTAHNILHDPCSPRLARAFLSDTKQRTVVKDVLMSSRFAERKLTEVEVDKVCEPVRAAYEVLTAQISSLGCLERPLLDCECYPELSDADLKWLLDGIKSEPIVEELLLPCQLPDYLSHLEKVEEAAEHARLLLLKVEFNVFFGCNFNYSELDAALRGSASEKEKLRDSSQLLWYMLRNPSKTDKAFRTRYLSCNLQFPGQLQVLRPEDHPLTVPTELEEEISEEELRVIRIFPIWSLFSDLRVLVYERMSNPELGTLLTGETLARKRVCQAHRLIEKVSPSPKEVYEVLAQSVLEGPQSFQLALKRKRESFTDALPQSVETRVKKVGGVEQESGSHSVKLARGDFITGITILGSIKTERGVVRKEKRLSMVCGRGAKKYFRSVFS